MNEHGTHRPPVANTPEGDWSVLLGQLWEWAWGLSSEVITAWATVIIAGCALWVARNQAQAARQQVEDMREHNRLSVTPSLVITTFFGLVGEPYVKLKLHNAGTGPAIIESYSLFFKDASTGKVTEIPADDGHSFYEFQSNLVIITNNDVEQIRLRQGQTIAANEESILLSFNINKNIKNRLNVANEFCDNINIMIKYQSIYKDEIFTCKTDCEYDFVGEAAKNEDNYG